MALTLIILFLAGLVFGSFLNVWIWRVRNSLDWVRGKSQCDNCAHPLSVLDLIPVAGWLFLRGRCRYCGSSISWQHPAIELLTGAIFAASYYFWPGSVNGPGGWVLFTGWLLTSVGLGALLMYDARWMMLPNKILHPTLALAVLTRIIYLVGFENDKAHGLIMWAASLLVASGMFWVLFIVSRGHWIGYGDVRLGLITGTVLADPQKSILMLFLASVAGLVWVIPEVIRGRRSLNSKLPYGPFLIGATSVSLLFGASILAWYKGLFSP